MVVKQSRPADLREACLQEALAIIEADGVEQLSLREVARRLGVSHQAPYKHFPSRDHILAEIVARGFESFAQSLDERARSDDPREDLAEMLRAYLHFARAHPLQYRLMFGDLLPNLQKHPDMMRRAKYAFSLLCEGLRRLKQRNDGQHAEGLTDLDALFVWSSLHGLARILQSRALQTLELGPEVADAAVEHVVGRLDRALMREKE